MSDAAAPPVSTREREARKLLISGPILAAFGIALTAIAPASMTDVASVVLLAGIALSVWGTHRFGRLGAEGETPAGDETTKSP